MKELLKLVNICQSYHKNKSVSFFYGTQCIITVQSSVAMLTHGVMWCVVLVCASCSPSEHDVAFQSCRTLQGTGAAVAFALSAGLVCVTTKLYITIILLIVSIAFYSVFEYRLRRSVAEADGSDPRRRRESADMEHGCDFTWSASFAWRETPTKTRLVPDFGSGKSGIRPFFGNPAKSGSGKISSRICRILQIPVQPQCVHLSTDKTNAADLSSGVGLILQF